jgi:hypothetical protein
LAKSDVATREACEIAPNHRGPDSRAGLEALAARCDNVLQVEACSRLFVDFLGDAAGFYSDSIATANGFDFQIRSDQRTVFVDLRIVEVCDDRISQSWREYGLASDDPGRDPALMHFLSADVKPGLLKRALSDQGSQVAGRDLYRLFQFSVTADFVTKLVDQLAGLPIPSAFEGRGPLQFRISFLGPMLPSGEIGWRTRDWSA